MQEVKPECCVLFLVYGVPREFRDHLAIHFKLTLCSHVIEEETDLEKYRDLPKGSESGGGRVGSSHALDSLSHARSFSDLAVSVLCHLVFGPFSSLNSQSQNSAGPA